MGTTDPTHHEVAGAAATGARRADATGDTATAKQLTGAAAVLDAAANGLSVEEMRAASRAARAARRA
ncbi:hypothetical protein AB0L40_24270 [Patulibacter sp. NPDC049589]|uniref:hypothetical protein n=1 Tax=Patulibacter sp. NPDC049589 TaxID=3154731 RepID=UPI00344844D9